MVAGELEWTGSRVGIKFSLTVENRRTGSL